MSFIKKVQERLPKAEQFAQYKNLVVAYKALDQARLIRPRAYHVIPHTETGKADWNKIGGNMPNIFVIRPSIYLNRRFDYFCRTDGPNGIYVFNANMQPEEGQVLKAQVDNLNNIASTQKTDPSPALLFEEFPLVSNTLHVPPQYQMHMFYGRIGLIQVVAGEHTAWMDPNRKLLDSSTEQVDMSQLIPTETQMSDLCASAVAVSNMTRQPYIRIDYVVSTRGPMFRGFACIPADVRSQKWRWFYEKYDAEFGNVWDDAQQRINEDIRNAEQAGQRPPEHEPTETEPENDNA